MKLEIVIVGGKNIAILNSGKVEINETQDALDLMADADNLSARSIIIKKEHLPEAFFNLKTRFAGEVLQKFSNYNVRLAIVGDFSNISSKALRDFIYESNRTGHINFVSSMDAAKKELAK
jgi:hypothetical protein